MDHGVKRGIPISTGHFLYQQVRKKSEFCDVTVKFGKWEKRYHRCVLSASAFFECAIMDNFKEREAGIIEIHKGTVMALDASIKFLYGSNPSINIDNVAELLEMAEFLIIPELKHACVRMLNALSVTASNCSKLLELSYMYNLDLVECNRFAMSHLPDIIREKGFLNVSEETLFCLLSDDTLSYVSTEDWFQLVVNWTRHDPGRSMWFPQLFSMLRLDDCDPDFIRNVVRQDPLVVHLQDTCGTNMLDSAYTPNDDVLVTVRNVNSGDLICLNLRTLRWHSIRDKTNKHLFEYSSKVGVLDSESPVIFYIKKRNNCILRRNLVTMEVQTSLTELYKRRGEQIDCQLKPGGEFAMHVTKCSLHHRSRILPVKYSTLFEGKVQQPVTQLYPVLTLKGYFIHVFCSKGDTSALLSVDCPTIFLYNVKTCQLRSLPLDHNYGLSIQDRMVATPDGFAVYNNDRVILLKLLKTENPTCSVKQVQFAQSMSNTHQNVKYFFCGGDRWFKFVFKNGVCASISYAFHNVLSSCTRMEHLYWPELQTKSDHLYGEYLEDVLIVNVPKNLLRCHMNRCPHCSDSLEEDPVYMNASDDDAPMDIAPPLPPPRLSIHL